MKKPTKTSLRNKADKLAGQLCRSKGKCEHCGKTETLQWCHIHSRSLGKLRYDERNCVCLCASCHAHFHSKPLEFTQFIGKVKGTDIVDYLIRESRILEPLTIKWYEGVIVELKEKLCTACKD